MTVEQMPLDFNARPDPADRSRDDADALVAALAARPELRGMPAGDLGRELGWKDRRLRAAAEASDGRVLSAPGLAGYRLAALTPVADYLANERARYRSQIRVMVRRLLAMDRAVHGAARRPA